VVNKSSMLQENLHFSVNTIQTDTKKYFLPCKPPKCYDGQKRCRAFWRFVLQ